ncbi:hypothetical protein AKJ09_02315 [Labilithrix luteola]|uniref:Uncharacterized protein n=1 Tax=Labilithrix luteola TaxID=1391654 RepID=A0A0K1PQI6_9BACT|nr:hypothetical protein AKJ09_02315 [Labilithrix luteola]
MEARTPVGSRGWIGTEQAARAERSWLTLGREELAIAIGASVISTVRAIRTVRFTSIGLGNDILRRLGGRVVVVVARARRHE